MNLKGDYNDLTSYSVGDVVRWTDDTIYFLLNPCKSGTPPTNTEFWERVPQNLQVAVDLIIDYVTEKVPALANNLTTSSTGKALDAKQGKVLKGLVDDLDTAFGSLSPDAKTLVLQSSTASSTKKFEITVDDTGELTATEITAGGGT